MSVSDWRTNDNAGDCVRGWRKGGLLEAVFGWDESGLVIAI